MQLDTNLQAFVKAAIVFLIVFGITFFGAIWNIVQQTSPKKANNISMPLLMKIVFSIVRPFDKFMGKLLVKIGFLDEITKGYNRSILLSGWTSHLEASQIYTAQILWGVFCSLLFYWVGGEVNNWSSMTYWDNVGGVLGLITGVVSPWMLVDGLADRRQAVITRSMPYAIDLVTSAMRGGMDFWAALKYYVEQQPMGPLEREFSVLLQEREHQLPEDKALRNFAHRIGSMSAVSFAGAIIHAHKVGAPLGTTLEIFGEEMRRERFEKAEQKGGRIATLISVPCFLCILPSILCFLGGAIWMKLKESGFFRG